MNDIELEEFKTFVMGMTPGERGHLLALLESMLSRLTAAKSPQS